MCEDVESVCEGVGMKPHAACTLIANVTHMMDAKCVGDLVVPRAECSKPSDVGTGTMITIPVQEDALWSY